MTLLSADLVGADIGGTRPDVVTADIGLGYGAFKVLYTSGLLTGNPISAGPSVRLLRLRFRIDQGLEPGSSYFVALRSGLGYPALQAMIFEGTGFISPAKLTAATVAVTDQNILRVKDLQARPSEVLEVEISAFNIAPLRGFSIGIKFDPARIRFLGVDLTDTITEAVGAEYVAPIIDNETGEFLLGVLLDSMPPFENQTIPAAGMELTIAKVKVEVLAPAEGGIDLVLTDGLGTPPIRNLFVIENHSYQPVMMSGRIDLAEDAVFLRADANADGKVDISDGVATLGYLFLGAATPSCLDAADADDSGALVITDAIYVLNHLFLGSSAPPAPYPDCGEDLTEDEVDCAAYAACE
jgi:hypothetical protein